MTNAADDTPQPLVQHLIELRSRLLACVVTLLLLFLPLAYFANELYHLLATPLLAQLPQGGTMIATDVAAPLLAPLKFTLVLALFFAMPMLLYQLWAFISPGLYTHEKRLAIPLLVSSIILFYAGTAFAYFVVFPLVFGFFTSVAPDGVAVMTDISSYLNFVLKLFFAFGLAFEVPIATVLVIWTGICRREDLAAKRPYVILAAFVLGMLLTPPDVFSQILLALPMWLLFEVGLLCARLKPAAG